MSNCVGATILLVRCLETTDHESGTAAPSKKTTTGGLSIPAGIRAPTPRQNGRGRKHRSAMQILLLRPPGQNDAGVRPLPNLSGEPQRWSRLSSWYFQLTALGYALCKRASRQCVVLEEYVGGDGGGGVVWWEKVGCLSLCSRSQLFAVVASTPLPAPKSFIFSHSQTCGGF